MSRPSAPQTHRSRLCGVVVDVPRREYDAAVRFYAELMGRPGEIDDADPDYASYGKGDNAVELLLQGVGDAEARVHLDIETDDVDAEVSRLVALGATEVTRIHTWVVMRDPVGTVFCVVRVQSPEAFEAHARTWS